MSYNKEDLYQILEKHGASYFAQLLTDDIIERILNKEFTLFVPIDDFYKYLCYDIPNKNGRSKILSIESLLQNEGIRNTIPNHVFHGHLRNLRPQTKENLQMLSRLILKFEVTWDRKKKIDDVPFVGFAEIGKHPSLQIHFIDGILANEDQYHQIYNQAELEFHEYGYDVSEKTGEPDLTGMGKHERCIYHIKAKNSEWCASKGYPAREVGPDSKVCTNPWAVCSHVKN